MAHSRPFHSPPPGVHIPPPPQLSATKGPIALPSQNVGRPPTRGRHALWHLPTPPPSSVPHSPGGIPCPIDNPLHQSCSVAPVHSSLIRRGNIVLSPFSGTPPLLRGGMTWGFSPPTPDAPPPQYRRHHSSQASSDAWVEVVSGTGRPPPPLLPRNPLCEPPPCRTPRLCNPEPLPAPRPSRTSHAHEIF